MKKRIQAHGYIAVLIALLFVIGAGAVSCVIYVATYNTRVRTSTSTDPGEDCRFEISPRGGDADEWKKECVNGEYLYGKVYRASLSNVGMHTMYDWTARINIHTDCYINSDWCGEVEIHQFTGEIEKAQTLDLRKAASIDITLDYMEGEPDLMIPLSEGDYIIYHPSEAEYEYPLHAAAEGATEVPTVVPGFIFYTPEDEAMVFDDLTVNYHLELALTQTESFRALVVLSAIWLVMLIVLIAVKISNRAAEKRIQQDAEIIEQSINVLTQFVDAKDEYTNGHSCRVANYARLIGEKMGLSEEKCRHLYYIALMHDCGKVSIPDSILKKPGKLTDEEYDMIKTHTTRGAQMLTGFTSLPSIRDGALYHHERYDGNGYPTGVKGDEIPLVGRIICVADSFDAMNSYRCYRSKRDKEYILNELRENRGKQFDPHIVDCFLDLIAAGKIQMDETEEG